METHPLPKHSSRRNGNRFLLGLILVIAGILFLLQQTGNFSLHNWWALFIFIPAFGSFSTAWIAFQRENRINEAVRAAAGSGLIIFTVAILFLFDLNWGLWWPLMILIPGFVVLLNGFTLPGSREENLPLAQRLFRPWSGWTGLGMVFLGCGFLLQNIGIFSLREILPNWWGFAILIPAMGGAVTAVRLALSGEGFGWGAISNLAATISVGLVGLIALLGIGWNLLAPIILIAVGIVFLVGNFRQRA